MKPRAHALRRPSAALLATLAVAAAGGCRDASPLRIGVVVSETAVFGALAAAEAVNAGGGIGGRPLELVLLPGSATDAAPAIEGAEQMAADPRVLAVVGHGNSAASLAASQVYNARGLVQIAPTSTAPLLSRAGPFTFRMVPGDDRQAEFLAGTARRMTGVRTAAIVYFNDDYGRGLRGELARELAARGVRVVRSIPYLEDTGGEALEFAPRRFATERPEVVFWLGRTARLDEFVGRLDGVRPRPLLLASDGVDGPAVYADPAAFAGVHFVRFVDPQVVGRCALPGRGRDAAVQTTRTEDVLTHDAVMVVVEVLRAGARTRRQVRDRIAAMGTLAPAAEGCAGPVRFDSAGDVDRPYLLARADTAGVAAVRGGRR